MQIINYEVNPGVRITEALQTNLEALEARLIEEGLINELILEYGNGEVRQRPDDFTESKTLRIYDFGTPGPNTSHHRPEYMYFQNILETARLDGDGNPRPHREYYVHLNPYTSIRYLPTRLPKMFNNIENRPSASNANYSSYGVYELGTLWFRNHIRSFSSKPLGVGDEDTTQEEFFELFFGQWATKCIDADHLREMFEEQIKEVREQFLKAAEVALVQRVDHTRQQLESTRTQIATHEHQLTTFAIQERDQVRQLMLAEETKEGDSETLLRNFGELLENVKIDHVSYSGDDGRLHIATKPLYLYSPDRSERALLGGMDVMFNPSTRDLKIINLTNAKAGRHHPHIPATQNPCWGVLSAAMRTLLRDFELLPLIELVLDYLENYNPEDPDARYASYWFNENNNGGIQYLQEDGSYTNTQPAAEELVPDIEITEAVAEEPIITPAN